MRFRLPMNKEYVYDCQSGQTEGIITISVLSGSECHGKKNLKWLRRAIGL